MEEQTIGLQGDESGTRTFCFLFYQLNPRILNNK
jgi:hypothetical protein